MKSHILQVDNVKVEITDNAIQESVNNLVKTLQNAETNQNYAPANEYMDKLLKVANEYQKTIKACDVARNLQINYVNEKNIDQRYQIFKSMDPVFKALQKQLKGQKEANLIAVPAVTDDLKKNNPQLESTCKKLSQLKDACIKQYKQIEAAHMQIIEFWKRELDRKKQKISDNKESTSSVNPASFLTGKTQTQQAHAAMQINDLSKKGMDKKS